MELELRRNSASAKRKILNIPRYNELKRRAIEPPEVSETQLEKILRLFTEDDVYFVISRCVGEFSYLKERWNYGRHEFCVWLKSCDGWIKSAKVRLQKAYQFSKRFWDMPFIVAYRFLGWIRALKSKVRAQEKEDNRIANIHFECGVVGSKVAEMHCEEMEKWKTRCEWVGITTFCLNMQKCSDIYQQSQKALGENNFCDNDKFPSLVCTSSKLE